MARKSTSIMDINLADKSEVSVLDAGLGVGVGVGLPALLEIAVGRWTEAPQWLTGHAPQFAALAAGLVAVPIAFLRGVGPALIVAAGALLYAIGSWVRGYLEGLPAGGSSSAPGDQTNSGETAGAVGTATHLSRIRQRRLGTATSVARGGRTVRWNMGNAMGLASV